ncbi:hypothetical protein R3P38DRAFT_3242174 [Favolaschia claudopus]|uniref:Uncharacterized protein n=1 Tax=Favolaschia claudopus TaxID=2862362 RepID=A0AAV9Z6J0_9AGAR
MQLRRSHSSTSYVPDSEPEREAIRSKLAQSPSFEPESSPSPARRPLAAISFNSVGSDAIGRCIRELENRVNAVEKELRKRRHSDPSTPTTLSPSKPHKKRRRVLGVSSPKGGSPTRCDPDHQRPRISRDNTISRMIRETVDPGVRLREHPVRYRNLTRRVASSGPCTQ